MFDFFLVDASFMGVHFLNSLENLGSPVEKNYSVGLIILSLLVSSLAAYTAITISLIIRDQKNQKARYLWLAAGAISMGCGIWAMHFIGMLSLKIPLAVDYDMMITLLSALPAVLAAGVSLYLSSFVQPSKKTVVWGGALIGAGIAAMHYSGMKGMIMNGVMRYDPLLMSLSLAVAVLLATVSIWILSHYRDNRARAKINASLVMGVTVFAMHFISMVGVSFFKVDKGLSISLDNTAYLATGISIVTIATLSLSVIAALVEHLLAKARNYSEELEKEVAERTSQLNAEIAERASTQSELENTLSTLNETQEVLIESEKMASLGGLVAGISHEINTPIGVSVTAASYLRDTTRQIEARFGDGTVTKSDFKRFLQVAIQSSNILMTNLDCAAELIRSFKRVAVDISSDALMEVNICDYLTELIGSLHHETKKAAAKIEIDCPKDLIITTSTGSIAQIVTNLVMNSIHHGFEGKESGMIKIQVACNNKEIEFVYSDDGLGMTDEVLEKIFEPFFTTKRGAGGSGLGMHILYNLITQSLKGKVKCESEPGVGTKFTINFASELVHA